MSEKNRMSLLVGDNPFHGISHLSQERSKARDHRIGSVQYAAELVNTSSENGANGFMFSVSGTTLSILRLLRESGTISNLELHAIVPYAYEYVRMATQTGGVSGLAKKIGKQIVMTGNIRAILMGLKGIAFTDLEAILKTYIIFEVSRIKSAAGKKTRLSSILLHEVITEMALAFDLDRLLKAYIDFVTKMGITPGFETRNFAYLINKFEKWDVNLDHVIIVTPLNKIGFQMNPSKEECEKALRVASGCNVIAMSILAAGYLGLPDAVDYIATLPNIRGIVVGVSKEKHALESFRILRQRFPLAQ
jgi:hypothetical protein